MSKVPTQPLDVVGFYLPRKSVDWDGTVLDPKTGEYVLEPSMTKQSFKEECDINTIVRRFEATGQIDHVNRASAAGLYIDLPDGIDLQASLDMAQKAEAAFMALPASVRSEFNNDPVLFCDAMANPSEAHQELLIKAGLAKDLRPPKAPDPVPDPAPKEPAPK